MKMVIIVLVLIAMMLFGCSTPTAEIINNTVQFYYHVETLTGYTIADIDEDATIQEIQNVLDLDYSTDASIIKDYFNKEEQFFMWNNMNFWRTK